MVEGKVRWGTSKLGLWVYRQQEYKRHEWHVTVFLGSLSTSLRLRRKDDWGVDAGSQDFLAGGVKGVADPPITEASREQNTYSPWTRGGRRLSRERR